MLQQIGKYTFMSKPFKDPKERIPFFISDRDKKLVYEYIKGAAQFIIAEKYKISKTRVRQILERYKGIIPIERRMKRYKTY